eukprot:1352478-Amphidinium_carterae.1
MDVLHLVRKTNVSYEGESQWCYINNAQEESGYGWRHGFRTVVVTHPITPVQRRCLVFPQLFSALVANMTTRTTNAGIKETKHMFESRWLTSLKRVSVSILALNPSASRRSSAQIAV